jgi:hypothetical protein
MIGTLAIAYRRSTSEWWNQDLPVKRAFVTQVSPSDRPAVDPRARISIVCARIARSVYAVPFSCKPIDCQYIERPSTSHIWGELDITYAESTSIRHSVSSFSQEEAMRQRRSWLYRRPLFERLQGTFMSGDRSLIAHLFRRAAFGARPAELDYYTSKGYEAAVNDLLAGRLANGQPSLTQTLDPVTSLSNNLTGRIAAQPLSKLQADWIQRLVTTTAPLTERMTLFLHNHWATAYRPGMGIDTPELETQNRLFRSFALGNWQSLCHSMIQDVALSKWLSNNVNVKQHPNENLAREFMELFTLGPGNYSETDVREAARALTGYVTVNNLDLTGSRQQVRFDPSRHDSGTKTILGQTGNFAADDFVDIVLGQPAAPHFLARKLAQTFVVPDPSSAYVNKIAAVVTGNGWELSSVLRFIFTSSEFQDAGARSAIVKTPTEFMVGVLRSLNLTSSDDISAAIFWLGEAGQALFNPPNVGGWPKNMGWLGAGGVLARYNAGAMFADRHVNSTRASERARLSTMTPSGWGETFGITDLAKVTVDALNGYVRSSPVASDPIIDEAMITLLLASADFLTA